MAPQGDSGRELMAPRDIGAGESRSKLCHAQDNVRDDSGNRGCGDAESSFNALETPILPDQYQHEFSYEPMQRPPKEMTPPSPSVKLQHASSLSICIASASVKKSLSRGKAQFLLAGLAQLIPLGMPRTSSRYKRNLSCADVETLLERERLMEEDPLFEVVEVPVRSTHMGPTDGPGPPLRTEREEPPVLGQYPGTPFPLECPPLLSYPPARIRRAKSLPVEPTTRPPALSRARSSSGHGELVVNFPGGGKFFYWQSGVATFLNQHFDLRSAKLVGASAGSLTATLMACHVDAHHATETAVRILHRYKVYERAMGLVGVWGAVVRDWLWEVLPDNAAELCAGRVHISVLCLPYRRCHVTDFASKEDLIETCLASAHLPLVMDGKPFRLWRGWPCMDGSILAGRRDLPANLVDAQQVTFDYVEDEQLGASHTKEFIALSDPAGLSRLVEMGYRFAERMSHGGLLHPAIQTLRREDSGNDDVKTVLGNEGGSAVFFEEKDINTSQCDDMGVISHEETLNVTQSRASC
ncbi:Acyl transferase/acyl hydrolase/lysophospholipase [Nannochloropsis gaditana]|uniref:Acyl transferase/acyl hydrolase/lysophospholipase n=1 Tax=Nannochloropsis gaditana TaxID=72520 RepID=W7TBH5_9STRA|nr:Acyl transferase/acyl hydrolase/lysophospholipase [Nannochloropsis gaditana]